MTEFNMLGDVFIIADDICEVIADRAGLRRATLRNHSSGYVFDMSKEYLLEEITGDRNMLVPFKHRG
jgi:hypothetical protein